MSDLIDLDCDAQQAPSAVGVAVDMTLDGASEMCGDLADHFRVMFLEQGWDKTAPLMEYIDAVFDPELGGFESWCSTLIGDGVETIAALARLLARLPPGDLAQRVEAVASRLTDRVAERELLDIGARYPADNDEDEDEDEDDDEDEDNDDDEDEEGDDKEEDDDEDVRDGDGDGDECDSPSFGLVTLQLRSRIEHLEADLELQRAKNSAQVRAIGEFLDGHTLMPVLGDGSGRRTGLGKLFVEFCS